jgi:hypothetical protein
MSHQSDFMQIALSALTLLVCEVVVLPNCWGYGYCPSVGVMELYVMHVCVVGYV